MRSILRIALCLAALIPVRVVQADDNTSGIKVDVVDDMTSDGHRFPHPDKGHPIYYLPIVKGDVNGGAIVSDQAPPPPTDDVLRMIAKALYDQGYVVASKVHPPSIILMFWWGTMAPVRLDNGEQVHLSTDPHAGGGSSISAALLNGTINTNSLQNADQMEETVLGSKYENGYGDTEMYNLPLRLQRLEDEWNVPRYYLTVSAMDFKKAMTKDKKGHPNLDVLWTARVSVRLWGHTLAEVLPTLIADGAPAFGRDTDGPQLTRVPIVPVGKVIVGTPEPIPTAVPASIVAPH